MPYVVDVTYDESLLLWHIATELLYSEDGNREQRSDDKSFCKLLSDYMMYLLIMQPAMMAAVAGIEVKPVDVKGDRSKSVLFDASRLAKLLKKEKEEKRWELLRRVWVELLSYAAGNCRANAHAQQVSKGGELLTFVWLLMAHFGLTDQFQINKGHARAKLIAGK
ncbi:hypothetical protein OIU77_023390 [Salix suchowensis]|uniref:DUF4220 domain-containing protein n=1 Tax=Salix suchowensis TaxID=1278906 RepID=A0ABQ9C6Q3_9ROSI|nr:hypothetical protein OIU77_023390 [Salix suchowensis]